MSDASTIVDGSAPAAGAAAAGANWHDSFDPDTKQWLGGMGLDKLPADQALAKVLPMYRGAEQKLGVPADQLLRMPKDENDAEGWNAVMAKLGRPENPDGYGLQAPEGSNGEFLKTASGWFHELGIPKRQAAGLAGKWNEYMQAQQVAADGAWNQRFDQEIGALKGEWQGPEFDKNVDLAKRVMGAMGMAPEQLKAIERAIGPAAMLKSFAKFGGAIGEHRFADAGGARQFGGMTPEAARIRIAELQKDSAWVTKYANGDADAKAEFTRLNQLAYPEAA